MLVVVPGVAVVAWYLPRQYTVAVTPDGNVTVSRRQVADERPPTVAAVQAYRVAAERPRYLTIDRIGVAARVLPVGLEQNGRIAAPTGIWDVGWYQGSVLPGEPGVSFIDGHITGPSLPAVFRDLGALGADDQVVIERGDGVHLVYRVREVRQQPFGDIDMQQLLTTQIDRRPTLVLMTCAGNFDAATYHYDQRIVVIATLT